MTEEDKSKTISLVPPHQKSKKLWDTNRKAAIKKAKLLYYLEYTLSEISEETGIGIGTLKYHVQKKQHAWRKQRNAHQAQMFEDALNGKKKRIEHICALSLTVLERFLTRQVSRESEISPKEAKLVSDILANGHRIARLEAGAPTDIKRFENLSPDQVREEARKVLEELNKEDPMNGFQIGEPDEVYRAPRPDKSTIN